MRGRKPKPRALRAVEGNAGRRPLPPPDPSTEPLGPAPKGLGTEGSQEWRRVGKECPWLRRGDRRLVELYCRSYRQVVLADRRLAKLLVEDDGDLSRMLVLQRTCHHARTACLRMLAEMGATATSRARVRRPDLEEAPDPAERYFA